LATLPEPPQVGQVPEKLTGPRVVRVRPEPPQVGQERPLPPPGSIPVPAQRSQRPGRRKLRVRSPPLTASRSDTSMSSCRSLPGVAAAVDAAAAAALAARPAAPAAEDRPQDVAEIEVLAELEASEVADRAAARRALLGALPLAPRVGLLGSNPMRAASGPISS
jgi:hypothetical protein